jgi:hypothetical protein
VPVVYDGRTRLVGTDSLLADVDQLVDLGARHITFGDPDFLNGPHHARRVVAAFHSSFPDLTFDLTAKVEHILEHRDLWPAFSASGCRFVVSAFESTNDQILALLDKGHVARDEIEAVSALRAAGIEPRPSFLPFTPWTAPSDVIDILDLLASADLLGNVDPVQLSIRLLVPPGSLLLASGRLTGLVEPFDAAALGHPWSSPDPRLDALAHRLASIAERAGSEGWPPSDTFELARTEVVRILELPHSRMRSPSAMKELRSTFGPLDRPRLSEPWYCCAEPTGTQYEIALGATSCASTDETTHVAPEQGKARCA